jgi:hypothetical protein
VLARCRDIRAAATANLASLADYGITQAKLTALKKKIDAFEALLAKPRQQIATSSAATQTLPQQFGAADAILNKRPDKRCFSSKPAPRISSSRIKPRGPSWTCPAVAKPPRHQRRP